jgi:tyrosyl-tRNA synthetase
MPTFKFGALTTNAEATVVELLAATKLIASKNEVKRLIEQGAVKLGAEKITDPFKKLGPPEKECIFQAGKRIFVKIVP